MATPAGDRVSVPARIGAALVALLMLALLGLAAFLKPAAQGHGTHQQLGLPPCGWVVAFGLPCPTCGMTTAFANAANASPWAAIKAQPAGALLALLVSAGFWASAHVAAFGSRVGPLLASTLRPRLLWPGLGLLIAAWLTKIATWT
jgi:hypothetical protein